MGRIHIVGTEYSFTYNACKSRYPEKQSDPYNFIGHEQPELVAFLLEKKIPVDEPSVVPLWNSNSGTIKMEKRQRTGELFLQRAGPIYDLWPEQIIFKLFVKDGSLTEKSRIFSVKVAAKQCSRFFAKLGVSESERFEGRHSTTDAADAFLREARSYDGLLCGEDLLRAKGLTPLDGEVTNPNNFTIFSTFNKMPVSFPGAHTMSLGCIVVDLDGNELPTEFIDYYKNMVNMHEIEKAPDVFLAMPKILFVLRYEESRALMLLEMDSGGLKESPWEIPEIESGLDFYDEVGRIYKSFALQVTDLFKKEFNCRKGCVFYGYGNSYVWACPGLNVSVHGYDKDLVRTCAKVQVLHLKSLLDAGIELPETAVKELNRFGKDPGSLKLANDSEPEGP